MVKAPAGAKEKQRRPNISSALIRGWLNSTIEPTVAPWATLYRHSVAAAAANNQLVFPQPRWLPSAGFFVFKI